MDAEATAQKLEFWMKDRVLAAGCRGLVLGMSGGLDSSVLAVLCQRAFPDNTLGVIMPCHSNEQDKAHAEEVSDKFGIPTRIVPLEDAFDSFLRILPDDKADADLSRMAKANLKARLRMATLYYIANELKYKVAGSSNGCEIAIGYFTKYGDGGVDMMPLGSLVKGQVRELARHLGIPQAIIDKLPSAGLWEGQTDEADMGFSYDDLDGYLLQGEAPPEVKGRIEAMMAATQHKRVMPPIPQL